MASLRVFSVSSDVRAVMYAVFGNKKSLSSPSRRKTYILRGTTRFYALGHTLHQIRAFFSISLISSCCNGQAPAPPTLFISASCSEVSSDHLFCRLTPAGGSLKEKGDPTIPLLRISCIAYTILHSLGLVNSFFILQQLPDGVHKGVGHG